VRLEALALALLPACAAVPPTPVPVGPHVIVLGTAQDAGLPQIGCTKTRCVRAARGEGRRLVSSLLLVDPRARKRWLFDASPDLREQTVLAGAGERPIFDGVFLTHAHIGHYTGLMFLGRESFGAKGVPVWGTDRLREFLTNHGPWSQLVALGQIELRPLASEPVALAADLSVVALPVPHRDELSDTVAFVIRGPERKLLYLPDIDKWEKWDRRIEDLVAEVDVALVDGTFYANGEIPGRDMSEIPHPFIVESLERFGALPAVERDKIWFTHLNHTNPAADEGGEAQGEIGRAGMHVAREAMRFAL
jgi:pyrroloquinoline quinone biosynthesis protein B